MDGPDDPAALAALLEAARALVARPGGDYTWSSWRDEDHALGELDGHLGRLRAGEEVRPGTVAVLFAPTGPLDELARSSGWGAAFDALADRFDAL